MALVHQLKVILKDEVANPDCIFKKGNDSIIVLRKTHTTRTTQGRKGVFNVAFAHYRASILYIERIIDLKTMQDIESTASLSDAYFIYYVKKFVVPSAFDHDINNNNGEGLYYFLTLEAALYFQFAKFACESKFTGTWFEFDYNGYLKNIHNVVDGLREGVQQMIKDNNIKQYEIKNGKFHGTYFEFENNKLIIKANYENDTLHGLYQTWDTNGILQSNVEYTHGNPIHIS